MERLQEFATGLTDRIRQAAVLLAQQHKRPVKYLPSSRTSKEEIACQMAQQDGLSSGLIAVFSCVEPCRTWFARGNFITKKLELKLQWGKCIHLYFYFLHQEWGLCHMRLQTWFPFLVQICLNGREWLARRLDRAGIPYRKEDNCLPWIADLPQAQRFMDEQLRMNWQTLASEFLDLCHPLHKEITAPIDGQYYWTAAESEYAADVMFRDRASLERIYPALVHHAVMSFGSEQVLRFLGRRSGRAGDKDQVLTDRRRGPDGVRCKHWLNNNSLKFYDKGSVLRDEVTINEPKDFKIWRAPEHDRKGQKRWRILRRSVADLHRRAEVSRAATERHLTALAAVHVGTPLAEEAAVVCSPVRRKGRSHRGLQPFGQDAELLALVNRAEWAISGFRSRDIRPELCPQASSRKALQRQMAAVGRRLRLLRAHGLIARVPKTHRYVVTTKGRRIITALLTARQASVEKLTALAA